MFGLMKTPIKDNPPAEESMTPICMRAACGGFWFMPQKNISGKRMPIVEVNSYLFDADQLHFLPA